MDLKRDLILKDLLLLHFERLTKVADACMEMCSMSGIPEYETKAGIAANHLSVFMALMLSAKPSTTPHEMGQIIESQYTYFKRMIQNDK